MTRLWLILCVIMTFGAIAAPGDIISYLRFEEGTSWFAEDQTGLMNGALLNFYDYSAGAGDSGGQGWSTSVSSPTVALTGESNTGSIRFAGGGAYVNLSNANDLNLGTSFTIEFFLRAEEPVGASPMYYFSPVNNLAGVLGDGPSFATYFQGGLYGAPGNMLTLDQWHHYALVKQPGEYSIYIDGILQFNDSLPSGTDGPYSFFGTDISGDREIGEGFRGYLDEFRISDTALTPDQFLNAVPEPGSMGLLGLGGLAFMAISRGRGNRRSSQS